MDFFWKELYKEKYSWFLFVTCLKITLRWKDYFKHRAAMKWTSLLALFFSHKHFVLFCLLEHLPAGMVCVHGLGRSWEMICPSDLCNQQQWHIAILIWHGFRCFSNVNEASNMSSLYFSNMLIFSSSFRSITHKPAMQLDWKCLLEFCSWWWFSVC